MRRPGDLKSNGQNQERTTSRLKEFNQRICVQLSVYANNVALPAFARRFCSNRSITPARRAHISNLQQRVYCCEPMLEQTDGRTDTIRYDTRCYFNVRSKANISQLNLPHGTDN